MGACTSARGDSGGGWSSTLGRRWRGGDITNVGLGGRGTHAELSQCMDTSQETFAYDPAKYDAAQASPPPATLQAPILMTVFNDVHPY